MIATNQSDNWHRQCSACHLWFDLWQFAEPLQTCTDCGARLCDACCAYLDRDAEGTTARCEGCEAERRVES